MNTRENNLEILAAKGYGVEERAFDNKIDLYDDKTFLFVDQFRNHEELAEYIKKNVK